MTQTEEKCNQISNPAKLLAAYMNCSGITCAKIIAETLEIPLRTVQRLKLEAATLVDVASAKDATCAISGVSADANSAKDAISGVSEPEALACADITTRATKESFQDTLSQEGRNNPPTPQGGNGDDLHRQAYLAGIELKGGKVAKSARATQRAVGELDGSKGITFADGELTVDAATASKIRAKFPGVDVQAVCNKAAPEVGRSGYPTRDFAAAVIGKWAQIQLENKRSVPASKGEIVPFKVTGVRHAKPRDEVANA